MNWDNHPESVFDLIEPPPVSDPIDGLDRLTAASESSPKQLKQDIILYHYTINIP